MIIYYCFLNNSSLGNGFFELINAHCASCCGLYSRCRIEYWIQLCTLFSSEFVFRRFIIHWREQKRKVWYKKPYTTPLSSRDRRVFLSRTFRFFFKIFSSSEHNLPGRFELFILSKLTGNSRQKVVPIDGFEVLWRFACIYPSRLAWWCFVLNKKFRAI